MSSEPVSRPPRMPNERGTSTQAEMRARAAGRGMGEGRGAE